MSEATPTLIGSTRLSTPAVATAASMALPPCLSTCRPACAASGWLVTTMPCVAITSERVCAGHPCARTPLTAAQKAGCGVAVHAASNGAGVCEPAGVAASAAARHAAVATMLRVDITGGCIECPRLPSRLWMHGCTAHALHDHLIVLVQLAHLRHDTAVVPHEYHQVDAALLEEDERRERDQPRRLRRVLAAVQRAVAQPHVIAGSRLLAQAILPGQPRPAAGIHLDRREVPRHDRDLHRHRQPAVAAAPIHVRLDVGGLQLLVEYVLRLIEPIVHDGSLCTEHPHRQAAHLDATARARRQRLQVAQESVLVEDIAVLVRNGAGDIERALPDLFPAVRPR